MQITMKIIKSNKKYFLFVLYLFFYSCTNQHCEIINEFSKYEDDFNNLAQIIMDSMRNSNRKYLFKNELNTKVNLLIQKLPLKTLVAVEIWQENSCSLSNEENSTLVLDLNDGILLKYCYCCTFSNRIKYEKGINYEIWYLNTNWTVFKNNNVIG